MALSLFEISCLMAKQHETLSAVNMSIEITRRLKMGRRIFDLFFNTGIHIMVEKARNVDNVIPTSYQRLTNVCRSINVV